MQRKNISGPEKIWNFVSAVVFIVLLIGLGTILKSKEIDIGRISVFELILLCIATYRMIRMIIYDKVFKLVRYFIHSLKETGIGASIGAIVTCPWCVGVWVALFNVAVFYLVPYGKLFIYIMVISGIATILQLLANYAGLSSEEKQIEVQKKKDETGFQH